MAPHRDPIPDERGFPGAEVIACIFGRFSAQRRTGNGYSERSRSRQQIARPYANVEVALQLRAIARGHSSVHHLARSPAPRSSEAARGIPVRGPLAHNRQRVAPKTATSPRVHSSIWFAASMTSLALRSASAASSFGTGWCRQSLLGEIHVNSSSKSLSLASSCTVWMLWKCAESQWSEGLRSGPRDGFRGARDSHASRLGQCLLGRHLVQCQFLDLSLGLCLALSDRDTSVTLQYGPASISLPPAWPAKSQKRKEERTQ